MSGMNSIYVFYSVKSIDKQKKYPIMSTFYLRSVIVSFFYLNSIESEFLLSKYYHFLSLI